MPNNLSEPTVTLEFHRAALAEVNERITRIKHETAVLTEAFEIISRSTPSYLKQLYGAENYAKLHTADKTHALDSGFKAKYLSK